MIAVVIFVQSQLTDISCFISYATSMTQLQQATYRIATTYTYCLYMTGDCILLQCPASGFTSIYLPQIALIAALVADAVMNMVSIAR
jgi:hypothetical protein